MKPNILCNNISDTTEDLNLLNFFGCERWRQLFHGKNQEDIIGCKFEQIGDYLVLNIQSEFKNYDDEIDKFIAWISPYVVGRKKRHYLGWHKSEMLQDRIYIHINR